MCMCVCSMHVCVSHACVCCMKVYFYYLHVCMYMCACAIGWIQPLGMHVEVRGQYSVSSWVILFIVWAMVCHWTQTSPFELVWPADEPSGSTCLHLFSSAAHLTLSYVDPGDLNLDFHACKTNILPLGYLPRPWFPFFKAHPLSCGLTDHRKAKQKDMRKDVLLPPERTTAVETKSSGQKDFEWGYQSWPVDQIEGKEKMGCFLDFTLTSGMSLTLEEFPLWGEKRNIYYTHYHML